MKNNVELFTPWTWKTGMWETLHLLSRYNQSHSVSGVSGNEALVSAYPSVNAAGDSLTVVLVNRSDAAQAVNVRFNHFVPMQEKAAMYTLSQLPAEETFVSHSRNALKKSGADVAGNALNVTLPAMSITSVQLRNGGTILGEAPVGASVRVFPNPTWENITVHWGDQGFDKITITESTGRELYGETLQKGQRETVIRRKFAAGIYLITLTGPAGRSAVRKIIAR